ncbi:MAG: hypothetical protein DI571_07505 [Arsenicicoccus sp.]|nr:MAG: hypothetical protein DI571_07505 [Arsenicicoccus sp.]
MIRSWLVRGPLRALRRVLAPASLELAGELPGLRAELGRLTAENAELRQALDDAREALDDARETLRRVEERVALGEQRDVELDEGLREARRLNLRIAELTDVVTELVLPLHHREVDPAVLARLAPDTL